MARLVRLDRSGNTELAAWSEGDHVSYEQASAVFGDAVSELGGGWGFICRLADVGVEK